jgi:drug/metabolite transporter (DMT)-like permease
MRAAAMHDQSCGMRPSRLVPIAVAEPWFDYRAAGTLQMTPPGQMQFRDRKAPRDRPPGWSGDPGHGVHDLDRGRTRGGLRPFHEAYLLLSLTSLFWSGNVVIGRFVAGDIPPVTISVIRWGGAFFILLPFAALHLIRDWPVIRKHAGLLTLLTLTGFSAYNTMAYYGLHFTTAIDGLLLQSVSPLFVALWSFILFRDRLSLRQATGIGVSLAGVVVIVCQGSLQILLATAFNQGDLWFVVALLIYAFYVAILRLRPSIHPLSFLAVGMGAGAVFLLPAMALEIAAGQTMVLNSTNVLILLYLCIFPSILGYLCLNRGIELIGANRAAPFIHLVPIFGSVLAIALLGERMQFFHAVGYALVLAGITLATRR